MSLVSGWMSSAGSVLTLNSRDVDEGVCDGKKKNHLGGGLVKHSVFVRRRGCCERVPFLFFFFTFDRLQIKEGAGICCMVIVPLFLLALFFYPCCFLL